MKTKFNTLKKYKEKELYKLLEMKKNWKIMSSNERHELHNNIVTLESDIKSLNLYSEIKNKFKL